MLSNDEILGLWAEGRPQAPARPVLGSRKVVAFARAVERAAYERAVLECLETAAELRRCDDGCTDGRYDWKADGALDCADAIRALGRQR